MKTKILYEDAYILVIHKPAGIAVQSGRVGQMDVESELKNYLKASFIGLVHRLDQPVEGLLVVAKTKDAAARLNKQLAAGSLNKKYLAVVHLEEDDITTGGDFTDYMIKDGQVARILSPNSTSGKVVTDPGEEGTGKSDNVHGQTANQKIQKAILHYTIMERQGDLALVDIEIDTGRFHQIRCQMAHHGMPLLGDVKYGSSISVELSRGLDIRQTALCANRISFSHPFSGKALTFQVTPENQAFAKFL